MTDKEFVEAMKSLTDDERKIVTWLWHNGVTLEEAIKRVTFSKTHAILCDLIDGDNNNRENEIRKETVKEVLDKIKEKLWDRRVIRGMIVNCGNITTRELNDIRKQYGIEVDDE